MKLTLLFLLIFLTSNAQEDNSLLSAQQIVSNASIRAAAENKNIFLTSPMKAEFKSYVRFSATSGMSTEAGITRKFF